MIFDPVAMTTIQVVPEGGLEKGQQALLSVIDPTVRRVIVTAGWQAPQKHDSFDVDIDLSAFLLRTDGYVRRDTDFIFYNNTSADAEAIIQRDPLDTTQGDREAFEVNFDTLPYDIDKISFVLSIHNCEERLQFFNLAKLIYIRVVNPDTGVELIRYNVKEDLTESNALNFAELIRDGMGWNFHATGEGENQGLYGIARKYQVNVAPV